MTEPVPQASRSLSELPFDELSAYATELGLTCEAGTPQGELLRLVRERQELLLQIRQEALLDIVAWARVPVRRSAGKEKLAFHIARITKMQFEGLSDRGLLALARLRGVPVSDDTPRDVIEAKLKSQENFWSRMRRKRRAVVGSIVTRVLEGSHEDGDYQFLPEDDGAGGSLRERIETDGVVGGIAHKLRGVADQYVGEKLDEIERRIDRKLDEIDARLCEWRDREIANRLRLIKITLIAAVLVAAFSLGYDILKVRSRIKFGREGSPPAAVQP